MRVKLFLILMIIQPINALAANHKHWVTSWAASVQGPYPSGYSQAQPDLQHVFPAPSDGACNQSFRMVIRPDVWGEKARIRLSNAFGARPVTFTDVYVGLHSESSEIVQNTNQAVRFAGADKVTVPAGSEVWSDAIPLKFAARDRVMLRGRKLAVSFHIPGPSGPMTWHAKALTTSYVTAPNSPSLASREDEAAFPYSVTSWFFVDAVDMEMPRETSAIVAFGDSLTDGRGATMNGDDRWPNVLSRRLRARFPDQFAVVQAAIAGNRIASPAHYSPQDPFPGGPAAIDRIERDVVSLSGVSIVIWLEGANDLSAHSLSTLDDIKARLTDGVRLIRNRLPGVRVGGATLTSALGYPSDDYGSVEFERERKLFNAFVSTSGLFDFVIDFDAATKDPSSGEMRSEFVFDTMFGGSGDKLHPNRLGYLAMGGAADIPAITSRIAATAGYKLAVQSSAKTPPSRSQNAAAVKGGIKLLYRVSFTRTGAAPRSKETHRRRRTKRIVRVIRAWSENDLES